MLDFVFDFVFGGLGEEMNGLSFGGVAQYTVLYACSIFVSSPLLEHVRVPESLLLLHYCCAGIIVGRYSVVSL